MEEFAENFIVMQAHGLNSYNQAFETNNKNITEDDERRGEEAIQKLTDRFVSEIDKHITVKESELMQI